VLYGMAAQGLLPATLGQVNARTQTPLYATAVVVGLALVLALFFPIEGLAEATARLSLVVFVLVNAALLKLKIDGVAPPPEAFVVPPWIPVAGLLTSGGLLISEAWRALA
jgi:amino acid transporter